MAVLVSSVGLSPARCPPPAMAGPVFQYPVMDSESQKRIVLEMQLQKLINLCMTLSDRSRELNDRDHQERQQCGQHVPEKQRLKAYARMMFLDNEITEMNRAADKLCEDIINYAVGKGNAVLE